MVQKLLYFATLSLLLGLIINSSAVADLIVSYDFEGDFKDDSGNGLHGKQNGDASIIKDADRKNQVQSGVLSPPPENSASIADSFRARILLVSH